MDKKPDKNPNISTAQLKRARKQVTEHGENFLAATDLSNQLEELSTPPANTRNINSEDAQGAPASPCEPGGSVDDATPTASDTLIQRLHLQTLMSMVHYQALKDLETMLKDIDGLDQAKLRLGVDLEGENLGRNGTATILQMYCNLNEKTYIIDLLTLQNSAFSTSAPRSNLTLRRILESPKIRKYFHDVRNDSDALYFHFGISLRGTLDTQLMENVTFHVTTGHMLPYKGFISGLPKCIQRDVGLDAEQLAEWNEAKDFLKGNYLLLSERPMTDGTIKYCVNDVRFLLRLADVYEGRADEKQQRMYTIESENRIALSQSDAYDPEGPNKTAAPAWDYWTKHDCRDLPLRANMGELPVCGRDCTRYWEQTHECDEGCACYAVCVQRMREAFRRFDPLTDEEKKPRVQAADTAEEEGERFILYAAVPDGMEDNPDCKGARLRVRAQGQPMPLPPTPPRHNLNIPDEPVLPTTPNRKHHGWTDEETGIDQVPETQGSPWVEDDSDMSEGPVSSTPVSPREQDDLETSEDQVPRQWRTTPNTPLRGTAPEPELNRTV